MFEKSEKNLMIDIWNFPFNKQFNKIFTWIRCEQTKEEQIDEFKYPAVSVEFLSGEIINLTILFWREDLPEVRLHLVYAIL